MNPEKSNLATAADDARPLGDVLDFLRLIWAIDHALQKASKHMESTLGITGPQRFALRLIGRFPGITAGELARLMKVHPSTLTGVLARLEGRRLMIRQLDQRDRRRAHLHLTAEGCTMDRQVEGTVEGVVQKVLAEHPAAALEATRTVLEALAREMVQGLESQARLAS
ncbi:MAG: MarR family transcriptional regulator [Myxococcaceae bacterium]|nr:MarR family transcriptional regulator [Myxococcaceae bacterium]